MKRFGKIAAMLGAVVLGAAVSGAEAQNGPQYQEVQFGYEGCTVAFGPTEAGYELDGMIRLATESGAYGFTYDPANQQGQLVTAPFPADCRKPLGTSPPLYLPLGPILKYSKQSYGFDGCAVKFGPLMTETNEDALIVAARLANAIGFSYQPSLNYGSVITGDYPLGCKSPANMSWQLYLADGSQAQYAPAKFGYNGCKVNFGPLQQNTTRELMNVLATEAGAVGFTYKESLGYGRVIIGKYPKGCESAPNMSWPLYLLHTP